MRNFFIGLFIATAIGLTIVAIGGGCAHVQKVVTQCEGTIDQPLIDEVIAGLAHDDYEASLANTSAHVLPCLVLATVQEVVDSLSRTTKASGLDAFIVQRNGRAWLAVHGGAK